MRSKKLLVLVSMLQTLASPFQPNDRSSFSVLLMPFISQLTMWAALSSSSCQRDLEDPQHLHMLLEVVVLPVLFLGACRSFPMFLNLLEETMDTLITTAAPTVVTTHLGQLTVNHTPKVANQLSSLKFPCTMVALLLLEAMEVSVRNSRNKLVMPALHLTLAPLLSQCKA